VHDNSPGTDKGHTEWGLIARADLPQQVHPYVAQGDATEDNRRKLKNGCFRFMDKDSLRVSPTRGP
jgi:hypothetical protein